MFPLTRYLAARTDEAQRQGMYLDGSPPGFTDC
jgi:hypothetical protein